MQGTSRQVAKFMPAIASFIAGVGVELSGYENFTLAVILWGAAVLLLGIPAWPWIKRWRPFTFAPAHNSHHAEPISTPPSTTNESDELKQVKDKLHGVEREYEALQKEHEELIADYDELNKQYEQLASLLIGEQQLKQEAHNLSEGLFGFAKSRKGRSDTLRRFLDTAVKENKAEEEVERIAQEKTQYDTETDHRYQQHYEPRIRALLSAVERRGWCDAGERKEIENIFNDSTITPDERIRRGAARIGAFGKRIL